MTTTNHPLRLDTSDALAQPCDEEPRSYADLDLVGLMTRIVDGDRRALDTLVVDRKPLLRHGQPVGIPDWIESVSQSDASRHSSGDEVTESARDLLYDRLTRMPGRPNPSSTPSNSESTSARTSEFASGNASGANSGGTSGGGGVDCRNYYRGFVDRLPPVVNRESQAEATQTDHSGHTLSRLEYNTWVHHRFSGYAHRHWRLCLREARRRQQRLTVAYEYKSPGVAMRLWVPASIPPRQRAAWIDRNFGPVVPDASGTATVQHRLQTQIDGWLDHVLRERERELRYSLQHDPFGPNLSRTSIEQGWTQQGLARTVAHEKAQTPERLRTSIAALGPERIKSLILGIFEDMIQGTYHPASTARRFGLHKSTLTRFAAARWHPGDDRPVPDLWLNTAQVLASQPRFAAALEEAGLNHLVHTLE